MKINRLKICAALLVFLFGFCTFALRNTRHVGRQMEALVNRVQSTEIDEQAIRRITDEWEKYEPILDIYSRHDEVERISQSVDKLRSFYKVGQYEDLQVSLDEITDALEHLVHTETPTISNIL